MNGFYGTDGHKHKYGDDFVCDTCGFPMPVIAGGDKCPILPDGMSEYQIQNILRGEKPLPYPRGYSVDELVESPEKFVDKVVVFNGKFISINAKGEGIVVAPLNFVIEGEKWKITATVKISKWSNDYENLFPYISAFLGKTIGLKVFANDYSIIELKFGDTIFNVKK